MRFISNLFSALWLVVVVVVRFAIVLPVIRRYHKAQKKLEQRKIDAEEERLDRLRNPQEYRNL